ncbi:MAG: glycosyltransferase [Ignavibacteriaceae bacterium]
MDNQPLVTINILSYNRISDLRTTLTKVFELEYKNIEVIVVDNASLDGSAEMVKTDFPSVNLIQLKNNIGIAGWNEGFKHAAGKYVLVLDDDSYPGLNAITNSVILFEEKKEVQCITFNVIDINTNKMAWAGKWLPEENINETLWPVFVGCAAIFRREIISNDFMPDYIFIYQHELPPSAKIYNKGGVIWYRKDIIAYHNCKINMEYRSSTDKYLFYNNAVFIVLYLPLILMPFYLSQSMLFFLTRSIKHKWLIEYLSITKDIIFFYFRYNKHRDPVNYKYFFALRRLYLFNYPLMAKIRYFNIKRTYTFER